MSKARQSRQNAVSARERSLADRDVIVEDYQNILTELALLATVAALLFGFLLSISTHDLGMMQQWLLVVAMIAVSAAVMVFLLPVVYHRLQYPYEDWSKFQVRSHSFISFGFPMLAIGFYASLSLALWDLVGVGAFFAAGAPIGVTAFVFWMRKRRP